MFRSFECYENESNLVCSICGAGNAGARIFKLVSGERDTLNFYKANSSGTMGLAEDI